MWARDLPFPYPFVQRDRQIADPLRVGANDAVSGTECRTSGPAPWRIYGRGPALRGVREVPSLSTGSIGGVESGPVVIPEGMGRVLGANPRTGVRLLEPWSDSAT